MFDANVADDFLRCWMLADMKTFKDLRFEVKWLPKRTNKELQVKIYYQARQIRIPMPKYLLERCTARTICGG